LGPLFIPATPRQLLFYLLVALWLVIFFCWDYKVCYTVLTFVLCAWYGLVILFRMASVLVTVVHRLAGRPLEHRVSADELARLDPTSLPVYTILVPMYKEPEVAQKIIRAVTALDYPVEKLDVKLLLEEDDPATREKIEEVRDRLPPCVEVVVCPRVAPGEPRTKPRACNWGLERAKGEYLVIYDAEDHPEPDQLRKAVVAFHRLQAAGQEKVVCLQAKLNYFNPRQNVLTRFFTLEYTTWFDLLLPGLHAFRTPIPLGGTSNHFRTDVLRALGGWDPFNVTEDCDLGLRLARQGYRTHVLDSTTWEEANSRLGNWIRQRSRWVKGYFQTHLVHTRDSLWPALALAAWAFIERLWARARGAAGEGRLRFYDNLTARLCVGWMSLMLLLNFPFWILTGVYLFREPVAAALPGFTDRWVTREGETPREFLRSWKLYHTRVRVEHYQGVTLWNTAFKYVKGDLGGAAAREMIAAIDPWSFWSQVIYPVAVGLFLANFVFVLLSLAACAWRGLWDLTPYAFLVPFYWVLISVGAFKGAWQLFWNPWYWEKTRHGFVAPLAAGPASAEAPRASS
jgi:cellulose synthase/poly-beta-1,6-N-acetylglucosamine synthase-like glycosyltransferase